MILYINNKNDTDAEIKLGYIIPMLIFPVFGGVFALLAADKTGKKRMHHRLTFAKRKTYALMPESETAESDVSRYLLNQGFPLCRCDSPVYFPWGEDIFGEMLRKIAAAKKTIYVEFFIVSNGNAFDRLKELLFMKAAEGISIKIIIDGIGSMYTKPVSFIKAMTEKGIECREFNPLKPIPCGAANCRDHRKILIVDDKFAFSGGINIADEYINEKIRFGLWKDGGVMVSGSAAESISAMFLSMWLYLGGDLPDSTDSAASSGHSLVQPFSDDPTGSERISRNAYLLIIGAAKESLYITTPYLVCGGDFIEAICLAAKRGVDVRIILPHIPDKKLVNIMTKSNYIRLLNAGVKIYEFGNGFIHSKIIASDRKQAIVGSINLDFRSFYEIFECGCLIEDRECVERICGDFITTQKAGIAINEDFCRKTSLFVKIARLFLKLISPLM